MFRPLSADSSVAGLHWLALTNDADEAAPPHALLRVTGGGRTGPYTGAKPDADGDYAWVASGEGIEAGATGAAAAEGPVWALYDDADGTPAVGETWGAGADTWKLRKDNAGFRVVGDPDADLTIVPVVRARGRATTTTTTTTTTPAPCPGSCDWAYSGGTKTWTKTGSTCGTGCACFAPAFCPAADACTTTACGRFAADAPAPNCSGTTTTPAPGGPCKPACPGTCQWVCGVITNSTEARGAGWIQTSNTCPAGCLCNAPVGGCTELSDCGQVAAGGTPCYQTTTKACTGHCSFVWVTGAGWTYFTPEGQPGCCCSPSLLSSNCTCAAPPVPSPEPPCGLYTQVSCYDKAGGPDPCQPPVPLPPPGSGTGCGGSCVWGTSTGAAWDVIVRACNPGCACAPPPGVPSGGTCAQTAMPCGQGTSTTSTSTTTTPSPCGGSCTYTCSGANWNLTSSTCVGPGGTTCGCEQLIAGGGGCTNGTTVSRGCCTDPAFCTQGTASTTTTTAAPATTTTTTTATTTLGPPIEV